MERKEVMLKLGIAVIFGITCTIFFLFFYPYHLFLREQMQLFLFTQEYFISYFEKPAALSCLLNDFLTQFFYFRSGGPLIISLVLCLEWCIISSVLKRMKVGRSRWLYALIPVFIEIILQCRLNASLAFPISLILASSIFLLNIHIRNRWIFFISNVILLPLLYILNGNGLFIFIILILLYECLTRKKYWWISIAILFIALSIPFVSRHYYRQTFLQAYLSPNKQWTDFFPYKAVDFNREKILSMDQEAYFGHWTKVEHLAEKYRMKNTVTTYYTNIAFGKRGVLPDSLLHYYQPFSLGLFLPVNPQANPLSIMFSNEVFFQLGDMNMAQHSTMLGMIFSPNTRSVRLVRRLAEINMINDDKPAAIKYLTILKATLFHKKWADEQTVLLMADSIPEDSWLSEKRKQLYKHDALRENGDYVTSLKLLVESNPQNKMALDYLLCYYLLNKDIASFMAAFNQYAKSSYSPVPRIYYEALLIRMASTKSSAEEVKKYAIPPEIMQEFIEYTRIYDENKGEGVNLQEKYGSGYWFYYHFAKINKQ